MHMFQIAKKEMPKTTAYSVLLDDIEKARYDLALAYEDFENAMEPSKALTYLDERLPRKHHKGYPGYS